jgi:hypothetical protein
VSENPTSEDSARGHGFDELARAVADGSLSRRRALKLFAGTAIASLIPSRALADDDRDEHDDRDDHDDHDEGPTAGRRHPGLPVRGDPPSAGRASRRAPASPPSR